MLFNCWCVINLLKKHSSPLTRPSSSFLLALYFQALRAYSRAAFTSRTGILAHRGHWCTPWFLDTTIFMFLHMCIHNSAYLPIPLTFRTARNVQQSQCVIPGVRKISKCFPPAWRKMLHSIVTVTWLYLEDLFLVIDLLGTEKLLVARIHICFLKWLCFLVYFFTFRDWGVPFIADTKGCNAMKYLHGLGFLRIYVINPSVYLPSIFFYLIFFIYYNVLNCSWKKYIEHFF